MSNKLKFGVPLALVIGAYIRAIPMVDTQLLLVAWMGIWILSVWIPPQAAKARRAAAKQANHFYHNNPIAQTHRRWDKFWSKRAKRRRQRRKALRQIEQQEISAIIAKALADYDSNRKKMIEEIVQKHLDA